MWSNVVVTLRVHCEDTVSRWLHDGRIFSPLCQMRLFLFFFNTSMKSYKRVTVPYVGPEPVPFISRKFCGRVFLCNLLTCCYERFQPWHDLTQELKKRLPVHVTLTTDKKVTLPAFIFLFLRGLRVRSVLRDYFPDQRLLLERQRCWTPVLLFRKLVNLCVKRYVYRALFYKDCVCHVPEDVCPQKETVCEFEGEFLFFFFFFWKPIFSCIFRMKTPESDLV